MVQESRLVIPVYGSSECLIRLLSPAVVGGMHLLTDPMSEPVACLSHRPHRAGDGGLGTVSAIRLWTLQAGAVWPSLWFV